MGHSSMVGARRRGEKDRQGFHAGVVKDAGITAWDSTEGRKNVNDREEPKTE